LEESSPAAMEDLGKLSLLFFDFFIFDLLNISIN